MLTEWKKKAINTALSGAVILSLQACTPLADSQQIDVAEAYSSSGIVAITPYTRSIISTHNF